jgi:hypothetical protein
MIICIRTIRASSTMQGVNRHRMFEIPENWNLSQVNHEKM